MSSDNSMWEWLAKFAHAYCKAGPPPRLQESLNAAITHRAVRQSGWKQMQSSSSNMLTDKETIVYQFTWHWQCHDGLDIQLTWHSLIAKMHGPLSLRYATHTDTEPIAISFCTTLDYWHCQTLLVHVAPFSLSHQG